MFHQPGMSGDCAYHNRFPQLKTETMKDLDFVFSPQHHETVPVAAQYTHENVFHFFAKMCRIVFIYFHGQSEQEEHICLLRNFCTGLTLTFRLSFTFDALCSIAGAHQRAAKVGFLPLLLWSVSASVFLTAN